MDKPTLALFLLFVAYTIAVYAPIHPQARYSIPVMPLRSMSAAIPLSHIMGHVFRRRARAELQSAPP
jgi:cbb3-type cytochrome oxidase subunit 3